MTCVLVGGVWLPVSVVVWAMWRACDMDWFELLQAVGSVIWNQKLVFENVAFRDLPTATRVVFNVYTKEGPAGWAGLNLFTYQRELKMGAIVLKMWPGECTADMVGTRWRRVRSVQLLTADTRHKRTFDCVQVGVFTSMSNHGGAEATTGELIINLHQMKGSAVAVDVGGEKKRNRLTGV